MKPIDEYLPKGSDYGGDGGCGDFSCLIGHDEAEDGIFEHTNDAIDEIIAMYVEDGNPKIWLQKIKAFKETLKKNKTI